MTSAPTPASPLPPLAPPERQPPNLDLPVVERKAGYAVVGLGELALDEVLPAFGTARRSRCTALASGHREKALRVAAAHGVRDDAVFGYDDFDARLRDRRDVDIVYLILPNSLHAEFAVRALEAGKHVLCEKPMATSVAECERMIAAAAAADRKLMVAYRLHHEPKTRRFAELCRSGALGRIATIESSNVQVTRPPNIRLSRTLGGGPVQDIGIYSINGCRMVTGEEPVSVQAVAHHPAADPAFREVPESVSFLLRYPSGTIAHCTASFGGAESRRLRAHGTDGWIELDPAFAYRGLRLRRMRTAGGRGESAIEDVALNEVDQFAAEMDAFSASVLDGTPVTTPGELGLADIRIVEAIERAIASGRSERL